MKAILRFDLSDAEEKELFATYLKASKMDRLLSEIRDKLRSELKYKEFEDRMTIAQFADWFYAEAKDLDLEF